MHVLLMEWNGFPKHPFVHSYSRIVAACMSKVATENCMNVYSMQ